MRKLLVSLTLATAVVAAVPAAAQYYPDRDDRRWDDRDNRGWNGQRDFRGVRQLMRQLERVEDRIQRSAQRGFISRREAISLHREKEQIRFRLHRASRNGLSRSEFNSLSFQIDRLERRVRMERRDRDGRRF